MRKAFDANIPKLKPRLRTTAIVVPRSGPEIIDESAPILDAALPPEPRAMAPALKEKPGSTPSAEQAPIETRTVQIPVMQTEPEARDENILEFPAKQAKEAARLTPDIPSHLSENVPMPPVSAPAVDGIAARRERLEKVKRKVAEASRTEIKIEPVPENPAQAAESVMGLVNDLESRLSRTRDMEKALRTDLEEAKNELARAATEGRTASERLMRAETQIDEKRKVLEEMLVEMNALEEERDQAVRRAQILTAQNEEREKLLDETANRAAETEKALSENQAENERLAKELEDCLSDNAKLRSVLTEVTRERDGLSRRAEQLTRERDEMLEAKKALEKVHQALAQARARLG